MSSSNFNKVLLDISKQLSDDDLEELKFLVPDLISKRDQERIKNGRELFRVLTERGCLSPDNPGYLSGLLRTIKRHDLSDKLLQANEHGGAVEPPETPEPEDAMLYAAMLVVAENLGRSWRQLGRRLGVSEVKLESIALKHPSDLEETAMELLKQWRKIRGPQASTEKLVEALRSCKLNLTADKVEDNLSGLADAHKPQTESGVDSHS